MTSPCKMKWERIVLTDSSIPPNAPPLHHLQYKDAQLFLSTMCLQLFGSGSYLNCPAVCQSCNRDLKHLFTESKRSVLLSDSLLQFVS